MRDDDRYAPKVDSQQILSFSMGKNTPERKDYIMQRFEFPRASHGATEDDDYD